MGETETGDAELNKYRLLIHTLHMCASFSASMCDCAYSMSSLLMHACSAEGGRVAVGFLQVRQGLFVQLHGISGKPAFYLLTSQMKPAARTHRRTGLTVQINMKIGLFDMEQ